MRPYIALIVFLLGLVFMFTPKLPNFPSRLGVIFVWVGLGFLVAQTLHAVPIGLPF